MAHIEICNSCCNAEAEQKEKQVWIIIIFRGPKVFVQLVVRFGWPRLASFLHYLSLTRRTCHHTSHFSNLRPSGMRIDSADEIDKIRSRRLTAPSRRDPRPQPSLSLGSDGFFNLRHAILNHNPRDGVIRRYFLRTSRCRDRNTTRTILGQCFV